MSAVVRRLPLFVFALLAVFAAILCIAAIHDRVAARPEVARNLVRKIETAEEAYHARFGWYAGSLGELASLGLIDPEVAQGASMDYHFDLEACENGQGYSLRFTSSRPDAGGRETIGCGVSDERHIKYIDSPMNRPATSAPPIPGHER